MLSRSREEFDVMLTRFNQGIVVNADAMMDGLAIASHSNDCADSQAQADLLVSMDPKQQNLS